MPAFEPTADEPRLESWKAIAAYLNRDVRTAKRWEVREGLPVHRHQHESRSSVYAYPREIDLWREGRKPAGSSPSVDTRAARRPWLALAAAIAVALLTSGGGAASLAIRAQAPAGGVTLHCDLCADYLGSVSRDGRAMALVAQLNNSDIGVHDIASGERTELRIDQEAGPDRGVLSALFSLDGQSIVYSWVAVGEPAELRLIPRAVGARPTIVLSDAQAVAIEAVGWTNDETAVVLIRRLDGTWEIGKVSVPTGAFTPVGSLGWRIRSSTHAFSVSTDGRFLAYRALESNPASAPSARDMLERDQQIFVLPLDGGDEIALTTGSGLKDTPIWMPDGLHVLYTSNVSGSTDLWAMPMRDGRPTGGSRLVRKDIGGIAALGMTTSGSLFYYQGRSGVAEAQFAAVADGAALPTRFVGHRPTWSPAGDRIAVSRPRSVGNGTDVVVREVATGAERKYEVPGLRPAPFDWFPDGQRLLVAVDPDPSPGSSGPAPIPLAVLNLDSGRLDRVAGTNDPNEPRAPNVRALSPDGATIYQAAFRLGAGVPSGTLDRIVAVDVESGTSRLVFSLPIADASLPRNAQEFALAVSPDGTRLAMALRDRELGATRVAVVDIDGSGYRELVSPIAAENLRNKLAWSRDGRLLYAATGGGEDENLIYSLRRIPVDGGDMEPVGVDIERLNSMSLSPDGNVLTYSTLLPTGWGELLWSLDVAAILDSTSGR